MLSLNHWTAGETPKIYFLKQPLCNNVKTVCKFVVHLVESEGNGTSLQYSCLENPMDRAAWQAAVHGVAKSRTRLSDFTFAFQCHALEKEWQPTPVFLPGESQGPGSLMGCHLWGRTELDTTEVTQQQQQQQTSSQKN